MLDTARFRIEMDKVILFLSEWLDSHLRGACGIIDWGAHVLNVLSSDQQRIAIESGAHSLSQLDLSSLISVFVGNFSVLRKRYQLSADLKGKALSVKVLRNVDAHRTAVDIMKLDKDELEYRLLSLKRLLVGLGASDDLIIGIGTGNVIENNKAISPITVPKESKRKTVGNFMMATPRIGGILKNVAADSKKEGENHEKWADVAELLFEDIKASLKLDFPDKCFGECMLLKVGDTVPADIKLYDGWQYAIVLKINENNPEQVAQQISSFNKSPITPYMVEGRAVWQFPKPVIHTHDQEKRLNTTVFLPKWLTNYLYANKGLSYCPDCAAVQNNLHADSGFSFQYLATYFPRTFAEVGAIFDWLFYRGDVQCRFIGETIFILDIGCGSGAATLSLIWVLKKLRCTQIKKIIVFGLDGNKNFLDRFEEMVPVMQENWKNVILEVRLVKVDDMINALGRIPQEARFDFIVSSKFVQEIEQEQSVYSELTSLCLRKLKKMGALCMLENYRAGRTEKHSAVASAMSGYKTIILDKADFTVMQIPNCSQVHESIGCQLFLNLEKEV